MINSKITNSNLDHPRSTHTHPQPDNQTLQLVAKLQDANVALVSERVRNQAIIDSLGEGLIIIDNEGKITTANPYILNLLGYESHELIGKWYPSVIISVDQFSQKIPPIKRPVVKALSSGIAVSESERYLRKEGSTVSVLSTIAPFIIDDKPAGAVAIFRDMTREKQLDIAKDEFVSLASHQLKTPASGVKAILSMLAAGDFGSLTQKQLYYIQKASDSNDRQLAIVEDLLHVAKIDSGNINLDVSGANIIPLIHGVVSEQLSQLEKRQQVLSLHVPKEVNAWIDAPKIRMVIDNLVSNASKYTPPGGKIMIIAKTTTEGNAMIIIQDSGVGISRTDMAKLFKKFSRIDNQLSHIVGGTGLGLYLAKSIIDLHNGTINVESTPGEGTVMTIQLPGGSQG